MESWKSIAFGLLTSMTHCVILFYDAMRHEQIEAEPKQGNPVKQDCRRHKMAEKIEFTETVEENVNMLVENGRKMVLAGLGAMTMAQEELVHLFNNLVERGSETEEKTRGMVNKQVENRQKEAQKAAKKMEKVVEKRFENLLHRMNIPSKNDIEKLSRKVTTLNKKVNELSKAE